MSRSYNSIFAEDEFASFKSISQVANEIGVEQHVLRFWESKFPQINPIKARGKRRLYSETDINKIKQVKNLLYAEKYTIEGAQKYLNNEVKESKNQENAAKIISELKELRANLSQLLY